MPTAPTRWNLVQRLGKGCAKEGHVCYLKGSICRVGSREFSRSRMMPRSTASVSALREITVLFNPMSTSSHTQAHRAAGRTRGQTTQGHRSARRPYGALCTSAWSQDPRRRRGQPAGPASPGQSPHRAPAPRDGRAHGHTLHILHTRGHKREPVSLLLTLWANKHSTKCILSSRRPLKAQHAQGLPHRAHDAVIAKEIRGHGAQE